MGVDHRPGSRLEIADGTFDARNMTCLTEESQPLDDADILSSLLDL